VGIARIGVINRSGRCAQVARAKRQSGDGGQIRIAPALPASLVVAKEEELVAPETAAESPTELVVDIQRQGCGEDVLRLHVVVVMISKQAAVKIIGARAQRDVRHSAASAP